MKIDYLRNWLGPLVTANATLFQDPSTPQYEALNWLAYRDGFIMPEQDTDAEDYRYVERYVAILLFFSFNSVGEISVLETLSVCEWNDKNQGFSCSDGPFVTSMDFGMCDCEPMSAISDPKPTLLSLTSFLAEIFPLVGSFPSELALLTSLESLNIRNAGNLFGSIPTEFGKLTKIFKLDLGDNNLSGSIPTEFGKLTRLVKLDLGNNQLSGSIPTEFGKLTNLHTIDLMNNKQLEGSIPSEIGLLTQLNALEVYNNQLSGTIPSEIGLLTSLTLLDLSYNNLQGSLPSEIENLTNLERLLYSNNNITGP
jgi:Leucine-rich repeat (LRR) protein